MVEKKGKIKKLSKNNLSKKSPAIETKRKSKKTLKKLVKSKIDLSKTKPDSKKNVKKGRVSSGVHAFDEMIQGGFLQDSINLVVGGSGSGKTIFGMEFLMEGIKKGENVAYVGFEESKKTFFENMKSFGWDLEGEEKKEKFTYLEYSPEKIKLMLDEGGGMIENLIFRKEIKRIVVDSMSSFLFLFDDSSAQRQAVISFFDILRDWNLTSILTIQKDVSIGNIGVMSPAELQADSLTLVYYQRIKEERKRYLEILKMRGTKHSRDIKQFEIEKGIVIKKSFGLKSLKK